MNLAKYAENVDYADEEKPTELTDGGNIDTAEERVRSTVFDEKGSLTRARSYFGVALPSCSK